jgi:hypothetical protein
VESGYNAMEDVRAIYIFATPSRLFVMLK